MLNKKKSDLEIPVSYCKFIHLCWHQGGFTKELVKFINDPDNGFTPDEHLFLFTTDWVYQPISQYENTYLIETDTPKSGELMNACLRKCDWLILHSLCEPILELLKVRKRDLKKIVWRTWGHEQTVIKPVQGQKVRNFVRRVLNKEIVGRIQAFAAIGIANYIDELDIRKRFGELKMLRMPYPRHKESCAILREMHLQRHKNSTDQQCVTIMVGHSGFKQDSHLEVLNLLEKHRGKPVRLYIPLAYGIPTYISEVKQKALELFGDSVIIQEEMLSFKDYVRALSEIDVAILGTRKSNALGNIGILLLLGKKIIFDRNSIMAEAFRSLEIPHGYIDDIQNMTLEQLGGKIEYEQDKLEKITSYDVNRYIEDWTQIVEYLENQSQHRNEQCAQIK